MGDTAGELANRLHLLALRELGFELALLGHVEGVDNHMIGLAAFAFRTGEIEPHRLVRVLGEIGVDRVDVGAPRHGVGDGPQDRRLLFLTDQPCQRQHVDRAFGSRQPEHAV